MNKEIFKTNKDIKKDLNNYEYVKNLTTLSPAERRVLFEKYKESTSRTFYTPLYKASSMNDVEKAFQKTIINVNRFIKKSNWHNPVINNKSTYSHNTITVVGYKHQTDRELINLHKYRLKENEENKQRLLINQRSQAKNIVRQCHSKDNALVIIAGLKTKYRLGSL